MPLTSLATLWRSAPLPQRPVCPTARTRSARWRAVLALSLAGLTWSTAQAQIAANAAEPVPSWVRRQPAAGIEIGSSFTAQRNGQWGGLRLAPFVIGGSAATKATVTVYSGAGWTSTSTPLRTVANVPVRQINGLNSGDPTPWETAMFDTPISVVQGLQYTFKLTVVPETSITAVGFAAQSNPSVGGDFFINGSLLTSYPLALFVALDEQPWLSGSPGAATVGTPFSFTPTVTVNAVPAVSFALDPSTPLPSWLSLNAATGALSGTPPTAGSTTVTLVGADAVGRQSSLPVTIVAAPAPVQAVLSGTAGPATAGVLFNFTPTVNADATLPLGFAAAPGTPLPTWLHLDPATGELTGTPPAAGTATVQIMASNALAGDSAPLTVTIVAAAAPVRAVLSGTPGAATPGVPFSFTPTVNADATQPIAFTTDPATPLPAWLTLNPATGTLSGTPPAVGSVTVNLVAINPVGISAPLAVVVNAVAPVAVPTLSEWGFALLGLLAAALGGRGLRRQRGV